MRMRSVLGIAKLKPVVSGGACAILVAGPALAEIKISGARITEGQLWVLGQADELNAPVTLATPLSRPPTTGVASSSALCITRPPAL